MPKKHYDRQGVYGDENMPDIDNFRMLAMGIRTSPQIDISPAFDVLEGPIQSGWVGWFSRPIYGTEIDILTSMDNGSTWDLLESGQYIKNADELNDNPNFMYRAVIKSYIAELFPEDSPKLFSFVLVLSDRAQNFWVKSITTQLEWD